MQKTEFDMTDFQKLGELKEQLIDAQNLEAQAFLEKKIISQVLATEFGKEHSEVIHTVQSIEQPAKPIQQKKEPVAAATPEPRKISQEEYIELLENTDEITDDDWKWFYQNETCSTAEAGEFLTCDTGTARRQAERGKINSYQEGRSIKLYRGSVILAKYDIPDSTI